MSAMVLSSDPSRGCVPSCTVRAEQMILPPSAANTLAISAPIPRLAPVTMMTFPSSLPMSASASAYDVLTFVEPTVELDNNAVRVIDVEATHTPRSISERLPWSAEGGTFGHEFFQQSLGVGHGKGEMRNTHLVQLQRCAGNFL